MNHVSMLLSMLETPKPLYGVRCRSVLLYHWLLVHSDAICKGDHIMSADLYLFRGFSVSVVKLLRICVVLPRAGFLSSRPLWEVITFVVVCPVSDCSGPMHAKACLTPFVRIDFEDDRQRKPPREVWCGLGSRTASNSSAPDSIERFSLSSVEYPPRRFPQW